MAEEKAKAHCNKCLQITNHSVLFSYAVTWTDYGEDYFFMEGEDKYSLMQCLGCDDIRMMKESSNDLNVGYDGNPRTITTYYPPSISRKRPTWWFTYEDGSEPLRALGGLAEEIYKALAVGAHRIAVMGIRALTEKVMIDQVGDKGSFSATIDAFFSEGFVARKQQRMFRDTLLEAGHAAMHRGFHPKSDTVVTLLDIIEGIIHTIYYQPLLASQIDKVIPKR